LVGVAGARLATSCLCWHADTLPPSLYPRSTSHFFYEGGSLPDKSIRPWFFSWTFCIATCTIISGCLAERTALTAYPAATLLIAALVHPLLVHWIWNTYVSVLTRPASSERVGLLAGGMSAPAATAVVPPQPQHKRLMQPAGLCCGSSTPFLAPAVALTRAAPWVQRLLLPPLLPLQRTQGWTTQVHECNVLDFAGGMVVHMVGGLFGLVGAWRCGPRMGRFELVPSGGEYDDDEDGLQQLQDMQASGGLATAAAAATGTVDSASDLLASSSPVGLPPTQELGAPDQQQQLQEASGIGGSRSLHTLLPSPSAAGYGATGAGGSSVEMGQLGAAKGGTRHEAAAAAGDEVEAAAAAGSSSSSSSSSGHHLAAHKSGVQAGKGFGSCQLASPAAASDAAGAPAGAAAVPSCDSDDTGRSKLWTRLRGRQAGHPAQRRAAAAANGSSSSGGGRCRGRLCKYMPKAMPGHDMAFVTLGTVSDCLSWRCWGC
jgi:hypothetical protein